MIEEELPDELENDLDDIEPVGDESQLYEHFRVVVDKGQAMVRVDKYLFERIVNASRNRIQKAAEDGFVILSSFIGILFLIRWLGRYSSPYLPTCAT